MTLLILGLILFLGMHSMRVFGEGPRSALQARLGAGGYKGVYSLLSLAGLVLVVIGYGATRENPQIVWIAPVWTRHVAALLTLLSFVLLAAAYVPGNALKARLYHPMVLGVKVWALSHLLANGMLADVLLFGAFLAWAVLDYIAARKRDRAAGTVYVVGPVTRDIVAVVVGLVAWAAFAMWLHRVLIGVGPFG